MDNDYIGWIVGTKDRHLGEVQAENRETAMMKAKNRWPEIPEDEFTLFPKPG